MARESLPPDLQLLYDYNQWNLLKSKEHTRTVPVPTHLEQLEAAALALQRKQIVSYLYMT